jgi:hypothetical protein
VFDCLVGLRRSKLAVLSLGALTFAIVFLLGANASALANGSCASGNTHVCSLRVGAYFDGNMPVAGGDVRVLAPRMGRNQARAAAVVKAAVVKAAVVKVDVSKGANALLGGLLDSIEKTAGLSGGPGIFFGLAIKGIKAALQLDLSPKKHEEDEVKEALKEIGNRIGDLHAEVENSGFKTQLEFTKRDIGEIDSAQEALDEALSKNVSTKDGASKFDQWLRTFLERAKLLISLPKHLNRALTATPFEGNPSLLAGVRRKIGAERFFTSKSSERIRQFFRYYEWEETRLAIILSEFYNLENRPAVAISTVKQIKDEYLPAQRKELPPRDLDKSVFIDTKSKLMWEIHPRFESAVGVHTQLLAMLGP